MEQLWNGGREREERERRERERMQREERAIGMIICILILISYNKV